MSGAGGVAFGLVGAISAFPRRLLARAVEAAGGRLNRGVTRQTTHVVFGRSLLMRHGEEALAAKIAHGAAGGRVCLSENAFLAMIGLARGGPLPAGAGVTRAAILAQSGLTPRDFDGLALFDAFARPHEPFELADVILARKYAALIAGGASWSAIARSLHRAGPAVPLSASALQFGADSRLYARHGEGLSELDGQLVFGLDDTDEEEDPDTLFLTAQAAEEAGRHQEAAALYARCLLHDPGDATAAFNRGNALREAGEAEEAEIEYLRALRHEPGFVEAWFNLSALVREAGRLDAAQRYLEEAVSRDADYGDAVFNLATLAFDRGDLQGASNWWSRYLELDSHSEWARQASRGLAYVAQQTALRSVGEGGKG